MNLFMVVPYYLSWHYSRGLAQWTRNLFNFLSFEFHFFSVTDLLVTLFAPFQRLKERHGGSPIDVEAILSVILVNLIMRVVGLFVRTVILILAAVSITLTFVAVLVLLALWIVLPLVLVGLAVAGVGSLLTFAA
jgi:hypothetical protein